MTHTSTQATTGNPLSVWLLPGSRDIRLRLEKAVTEAADHEERRAQRIRILGSVARNALLEEIEAKLRLVLNETLGDLVVGGWRAHTAIRAAVRKSRNEPGVDQVVPLHNHTVKADRELDLDVEVDGVHVMTLTARLEAALQVYDAVAVVCDGHLAAVRSGQAHATARLSVEHVEIATRTLTFPLSAELVLHPPPSLSEPPGEAILR